MCDCLLCAPYRGPGPQPRHVPRLEIEPVTLWFTHLHSIHWAPPTGAKQHLFLIPYSSRDHLCLLSPVKLRTELLLTKLLREIIFGITIKRKPTPYVISKHTILLHRHIDRVIIPRSTFKQLYIFVCRCAYTHVYVYKVPGWVLFYSFMLQ